MRYDAVLVVHRRYPQKKVLLVDDDALGVHAVARLLGSLGLDVTISDGSDAGALLRSGQYAVAILDEDLGRHGSGLRLIHEARRARVPTSLILLHGGDRTPPGLPADVPEVRKPHVQPLLDALDAALK